jgi:hypothetical protein
MKWYNQLLRNLQVSGNGAISGSVVAAVMNGLIKGETQGNSLDSDVYEDVNRWFNNSFNPWFAQVSQVFGLETQKEDLLYPDYYAGINELISALNVSRSYYELQGSQEIITSLETVAYMKALICEELSNVIISSYEKAIGVTPDFYGKSDSYTIATEYTGTTPERFVWPENTVISYHKQFLNMNKNEKVTDNIPRTPKQYLPWVFTVGFGLIAWAAAAKK